MVQTPISLADALRLAEWGPRQLVAAINSRLSLQGRDKYRLDPTAAYPWVRRGFRPRPPIPDLAAAVLSEQLGFAVSATQLWPGREGAGDAVRGAADSLDSISCLDDLVGHLNDLSATATTSQTRFVGSSGPDLTMAVLDQLRNVAFTSRDQLGRERVLPEQVELISTHVTALRRLDDRHGGGALSLRYVTAEFRSVLDLFQYANYEPKIGRRLLTIVADLAQLLGWLQFDSGRYGPAERYLLLSIGVCRAVQAADRAANAIGMLSYVSTFADHGSQALLLAEAAERESGRGDRILHARLLGREATAAAADGDLARFRRSSEEAMRLLVERQRSDAPAFLYYLAPEQLAAEAGQGLVALAEQATSNRKRLLGEAIDTLSGAVGSLAAAGTAAPVTAYPRSALLHTTFLARAYLLNRDLPAAVDAMRTAVGLLARVQSPRGRTYLRSLRPALARRTRSRLVAEFLPQLDEALSRA
ncbi:hypothetical protein [Plantactinospora endophytica]|uniref:Transcriptional regulator n=1 Tax=Plantactinospora endophytica TaxID=673535 RepID=A0ABQ4DY32_9ACTN|nr:hypothetical protein [Plantactinospora endophytica]GIG87358.1 hypothetical protein Pen02_22940 [Plantactinospora endophytica]